MGRRRILRGALGALALAGLMFGANGGIQALQTVPGGNLVGHWPLDVATSPSPDVSGGVANDATLVAAPTAAVGVFGPGLAFNGTSQFMTVANEASLDVGTGSYSVGMWIKPSDVTNLKRMFNKWNAAANKGILMDINAGVGGTSVGGNLRFRISDGTNNLDYVQAAGFLANQWYHIAGVVDRSAAPGTLKIFVNGVQLGTTQNLPAALGNINVTDGIHICEFNGGGFFAGIVDEVLFYTRALSTSEVENLYFGGNMSIAVGRPSPVVAQHGLLAKYYNNNAQIANTMTPPGSPNVTISTTATLALTRLDTTVNFDWGTGSPAAGINVDDFFAVWTGKLKTPPSTGNYQFGTISDDGVRLWVNNVLVRDDWVDQGPNGTPEMSANQALTGDTVYDIRLEVYERGGGAVAKLFWLLPNAAAPEVISSVFLTPGAGPAAPTNLTATATANSVTPQVVVTWTAPAGNPAATSYIVSRATAPGGPFTQVSVQTATTFTDTTVAFGTAYYYTVQPTAEGGILVGTPTASSNPGATPIQPAVSATPTSGLITSEAGLNDTITLTVNVSPVGGNGNVQITSSAPAEALVSTAASPTPAPAVNLVIPANTPVGTTFTVTVHGQNDFVADGPVNYNITFVVTGPVTATNEWNTTGIAPVSGTNSDNDTPGITVTQLSGPTTESAGTATFIVVFDTQPSVNTTMSVTSSNTGEALVSSGTLTFNTTGSPDPDGWNVNHVVTVTGVDDTVLDFTQPFTISLSVTGGDPVYVAMTAGGPIVRNGINLDNETIPALDPVWGSGGGGCGLTGLETGLFLALAALLRRRRSPK